MYSIYNNKNSVERDNMIKKQGNKELKRGKVKGITLGKIGKRCEEI